MKTATHHADHRELPVVQPHLRADDVPVGPEPAAPECIAENHHLSRIADSAFLGSKAPAQSGLEAQHIEVVVRDELSPDALRLAAADAVLVPSQESFGRVAVEAMLAGTPVIASRWGASPEIISDGETGILYEPRDSEGLAAQIRRLIDHPGERERLTTAARESARERFGAQRFADRLLGVLTSACDAGQVP